MLPTLLLPNLFLLNVPWHLELPTRATIAHPQDWPGMAAPLSFFDGMRTRLESTHPRIFSLLFSQPPFSVMTLPAMTLLAILAPGFRSRKVASPSVEVLRPEAVRTLRGMRRDAAARFTMATAGDATLAVEQGVEGHLLVHYVHERGALTIAGGWLGAGRRRYVWLPLRPTLAWNAPLGPNLNSAEIGALAADLHTGLDLISTRHVLEEFFEPAPIPEAERREVLDSYARFMGAHGWHVTYDETLSRRSMKRTNTFESPQNWSSADREALTRLEALVSEMLKGVRSSSRILFQTK